ncbi:uncharacterized protein LOC113360274 [Papaver somniferum]|uniref:uncharacterized protein LOC113334322 n=1 Tax=Papaver somniferum TaxID=3469 RepID=UPI000E6F4E70|nr:uncharacterized protein LOC113334322 [Papaver somniferum]XP_026459585.1 uncharacterized protein LOC113360274 [Papaver somniferum]
MSQCGKSLMVKTVTNTIPAYSMICFQIPAEIINKIDAAQRDYRWGFDEKRGTYVTSWKNMKIHKYYGGQGFRDMKILNQALLVREAWRICTNTDTQWGKAVQEKYFSCTSFLHAPFRTNCSCFIKQHSQWRLGKGDKIEIWLDIWVIGLDVPPVPRIGITDSESYI